MIAVDIECFDPQLKDLGDGAHRGDGKIICVGLYDGKDYVCCRPEEPRLRDWLASDEDKVFHNGIYDLSWLICGQYQFKVGGRWHDTMTRCTLLNEYAPLDLESCCKKYGVKGKNFEDTIEAWFDSVKKQWGMRGSFWANLDVLEYMQPDELWKNIEKYNRQDCKATYDLFMATEPLMKDVREPYELECRLYPLWLQMKKIGVRVDKLRMERLLSIVSDLKKKQEQQLWHEYQIDSTIINSPKQLTVAMNRLGVHSPNKTATGNESWDNKSMPLVDHPAATKIMNYKNLDYISGAKGIGKLLKCCVGDRIYTTFYPCKREEGGAYTGRLGSRAPNLQNLGSREDAYSQKAWGPEIRSLFLPDEGNNMLAAVDYGQIEFRLFAHYSVGTHAEWFREQCRNPTIDMHGLAMERTGIKSRYIIKRINFGVPYGMGIKRMVNLDYPVFMDAALEHGYTDPWKYGDVIYQQFKDGFPVLFDMMANIENIVKTQGYIVSVGGRIRRKPPAELSMRGTWTIPYYKMTCVQVQGCLPYTSTVLTDTGYKQIFELDAAKDKLVTPAGDEVNFVVIPSGKKKVTTLRTRYTNVTCSPEHKWGVYKQGRLAYVPVIELAGEQVYVPLPVIPADEIRPLAYSTAYLAGIILADGHVNFDDMHHYATVTGGVDSLHILHELQLRHTEHAEIRKSTGSRGDTWVLNIGQRATLDATRLESGAGANKRVPKYYFTAPIHERIELLRGLWDGDGGTSSSCILYTSISEGLVDDIQLLMHSIGILTNKRVHNNVYRLFVQRDFYDDYLFLIGSNKFSIDHILNMATGNGGGHGYGLPADFVHDCFEVIKASPTYHIRGFLDKQERTNVYGFKNARSGGSRRALIYYLEKCKCESSIQYQLLLHGTFTPVKSIDVSDELVDMCDISIIDSDDHTYICSGMSTHNSAAEILKKGLLDAYEAGIFDVTPLHLTVHDENVTTTPFDKIGTEATQELTRYMQNAYAERLTVPLTSSAEVGPNWGYWAGDIWEAMQAGDYNPEYFKKVYAPKVKKDWWVIENGYQGLDGALNIQDKKRMQ